jgi:HB1, ASXL, restriction endonuclease HTH domain
MNTFKSSAIQVLKKAGKPLHYSEITKMALETGLLVTEGATPDATMCAQLVMDVKNKGKASDFIKTGPSTFYLNPNKEEKQIPKMIEKEKAEDEKIVVDGGYTGKGGEHLVASELLFRGYNASIMSVDTGIDISSIKDNKFFGIQVKTSNLNNFDVYNFHIRRVSFDRHNQGNTFYAFVLRGAQSTKFLILPSSEIERKIKERAIYEVNNKTGYALSIKIRDNKIYLGGGHDMSYFLNKWDLIK